MQLDCKFQCAQQLVDSLVADADRLLSHWFSRALVPGSERLEGMLHTLIETLLQQPIQLKIELNQARAYQQQPGSGIKGTLHIFTNPNFAINLDALNAEELKWLSVIVCAQPHTYFTSVYSNASTNTQIYSGLREKRVLCLSEQQRLLLVKQACFHSLYLCTHVSSCQSLLLKDMLLSLLLDHMHTVSPPLQQGLSTLYQQLSQPVLPQLEGYIHCSPTSARLRESVQPLVEEEQQCDPAVLLRRSCDKSAQPRNYFLGSDWFARAYRLPPQS